MPLVRVPWFVRWEFFPLTQAYLELCDAVATRRHTLPAFGDGGGI